MDQILSGLLKSDKPEGLKRQMIQKIIHYGAQPHTQAVTLKVFSLTTDYIVRSNSEFEQVQCKQVYLEWARCNRSTLEQFVTRDHVATLMDSPPGQPVLNALWLISESMKLLRSSASCQALSQIVQLKAISFVRSNHDWQVLTQFCRILQDNHGCIPLGDFTVTFCTSIIYAASTFQAPKGSPQAMHKYLREVSSVIGGFLNHIWQNSDRDCLMKCLQTIFQIISYTSNEEMGEPSNALSGLVQFIPTELIEPLTKSTVSDSSIQDENMTKALSRMIHWLTWPLSKNIDKWIVAFLNGLASVKKYKILIEVTAGSVEQVYDMIHVRLRRDSAFEVISHMLLSYQHNAEAFHKIVGKMPGTVRTLQGDASPEGQEFLVRFVELVHCLMQLHPGFPELYDPVLDAIKGYPRPSAEIIQVRLACSKWTASQGPASPSFSTSSLVRKSETGKTGLVNLGNTCFMNSILQALYMSDSFRQEVLHCAAAPSQKTLKKLQRLFAHLSMSQRASYSPDEFLQASRPPWFTAGHQQDCSEFLKYLLDQLHEQERVLHVESAARARTGGVPTAIVPSTVSKRKLEGSNQIHNGASAGNASVNGIGDTGCGDIGKGMDTKDAIPSTLSHKSFGGTVSTTYTCLKCLHKSVIDENFTDIPLAFPNQDNPEKISTRSSSSQNTLIGGNSSGQVTKDSKSQEQTEVSRKKIALEELLKYYLEPERLQGDNKYHCSKCGTLQDGERTIEITSSPNYLFLTLLRFSYDKKLHARSKIFTDVIYPKTLKIPVVRKRGGSSIEKGVSKKCKTGNGADVVNGQEVDFETYSLSAVVVHSGLSSDSGHYYCYSRHSIPVEPSESMRKGGRTEADEDLLQDKWYLFNDSRVSYSSYSSFSKVTSRFSRDTAYVLMYKKISSEDYAAGTIDPNESIFSADVDPPLRKDLMDLVSQDNKKFQQEQEKESQRIKQQLANKSQNATWYPWNDPDDKGGPPGSCGGGGGGGLGGLDTSGSRFVF